MSRDTLWPRAIILVDMNAFFASIEQYDNPKLQGQPVAVTNGDAGTCIITSSYEARAYGVKTGMRLPEARRLCPSLIVVPSRPKRYTLVSRNIMAALEDITPDIEVFSVDEAFLDVTHCQRLHGPPELIGQMTKDLVQEISGVTCSVGVSGDKTTAKYAAKLHKPNGLTVIPPWDAANRLSSVPVTELCGISKGIGNFLAQYGVLTCGDMQNIPISILASRFGNLGRRIWYMCQGADPDPVQTRISDPKSMGHGKVMPPNTRDNDQVLTYLLHMCEKLGARLRCHHMEAQRYFIGLRSYELGWLGAKGNLIAPSNDSQLIYQLGQSILQQHWQGQRVGQVQVTALDPQPSKQQMDLFLQEQPDHSAINQAKDTINQRFGELTLAPARLLHRTKMHDVIAPAWQPKGPRDSVE